MSEPHFDQMAYSRPDLEALSAAMGDVVADLGNPQADGEAALRRWQDSFDQAHTMARLANVKFRLDTTDEAAKAEKAVLDKLQPELTELDVQAARALLEGPHAERLREAHGDHHISILKTRVASFDPALKEPMAQASELTTAYDSLMASASFTIQGETVNAAGLVPYAEDPDRAVRLEAQQLRFGHMAEHAEELDRIFDELVALRHGMGKQLGHETYTPLAYQLMGRTDYGPDEVASFRRGVVEHIVPLASELVAQQTERLGLERMTFVDEPLKDPGGNPRPGGDDAWVIAQARRMYEELGPEFGEFFNMLIDRGLADLSTRPGKAAGGFCTSLPVHKVPYIFANFNGTTGDVRVLTHECGHAIQSYLSRDLYPAAYRWPTAEACEIHSMALEYLTWPWMELFFGDDAERFRHQHLEQAIRFLPYGCLVDHFQHELYAQPQLTAAERKALWLELERTYLPHRDYDGLVHVSEGGLWQRQLHIYRYPFYYIDYCLALTGALQFWTRAEADRAQATADYLSLCRLGGSQPYTRLLESAGLSSPFETETLAAVASGAKDWLER